LLLVCYGCDALERGERLEVAESDVLRKEYGLRRFEITGEFEISGL
jgi:hypothetical protein